MRVFDSFEGVMEAFLTSTLAVAIAEIGDKTQLLAFVLAAKFRRPLPIIFGIIVATLANHALAAWVGTFSADILNGEWVKYLLAGGFFAMAAWVMIPDKLDDKPSKLMTYGPFLASLLLFFVAEMGDKTQVATVLLAAKYDLFGAVLAGTTLGMLLANVPVVLLGRYSADSLPLTTIRMVTAILFALLAITTLFY